MSKYKPEATALVELINWQREKERQDMKVNEMTLNDVAVDIDSLVVHQYLRLEEFVKLFNLKSAYVKQLTEKLSDAPLLMHLTFLPEDRENYFFGVDTPHGSYVWVVKRLGLDKTYNEVILYVDMVSERQYESMKPHEPYDSIALLKPLLPPTALMQFNIYARTAGGIENDSDEIKHYEEECLEVYTNPTYFNKFVDKSILDKLAFEPHLSVGTHVEGKLFSGTDRTKEYVLSVKYTVIKEEEKENEDK
jgi:hypothetical protein